MAAVAYLTRKETFSAAHHYRMDHMPEEEAEGIYGPLGVHGHNYVIELTIRGEVSERTGMVENLKSMKRAIHGAVLAELDNRFLNEDVPFFRTAAPTLENLSRYVWGKMAEHYPGEELSRLRIAEKPTLYVERKAGGEEMFLTRGYHFCAAHRLHRPELTSDENRDLFGKCNNPTGHGHNYSIEVTVRGAIDERTGTICNVGEIDRIVNGKVVEYLDHTHLNLDVDEFRDLNPTAENIARVIWDRIGPEPGGAALHRVRVYETERNIADYYGNGGGGEEGS